MLSTVSILGVDDSVSPADLVDISQMYPFVEWGINLCSNAIQKPACPSDEWLEELLNQADRVRLRGVLHGRWEHDILKGTLSIREEKPEIWDSISRIQVDIRKGHHNIIEALQLISNKEVILSTDNPGSITNGIKGNASLLFPREQAFTYPGYCGYSLTDKDVALMEIANTDNPFWLSIEGFRADDGITLDIFKIERFLDSAEDQITDDSWFRALMQTEAVQKRFSDHP